MICSFFQPKRRASQVPWATLEAGVWENIFDKLDSGEDIRNVRLTCKLFKCAAARTARMLTLGQYWYADDQLSLPMGTAWSQTQAVYFPGSLTRIHAIRIQTYQALPQLSSLTSFTSLQELCISLADDTINARDIELISTLQKLRVLQFQDSRFADSSSLTALQRLSNLKALVLTKTYPQDVTLMEAVGHLTGLTALQLTKPFCFKDQGYGKLSSLTALKHLHLGWSWRLGGSFEKLDFLSSLSNLEYLNISKCFVSDEDLRNLSHLRGLRHLCIHICHNLQGQVFRQLSTLENLTSLDLSGSNMISNTGVDSLATITTLRSLNLGASSRITAESCLDRLSNLKALTELRVPPQVFTHMPFKMVQQKFLLLKTYSQLGRCNRVPGQLEERLRRMLQENDFQTIIGDENGTHGYKLKKWFHTGSFV